MNEYMKFNKTELKERHKENHSILALCVHSDGPDRKVAAMSRVGVETLQRSGVWFGSFL